MNNLITALVVIYWLTVGAFAYNVARWLWLMLPATMPHGKGLYRDMSLDTLDKLVAFLDSERKLRRYKFGNRASNLYLACGLLLALSFKLALPATSYLGFVYLTVFWLPWQLQDMLGYTMPVGAWAFNF